LLRQVPRLVVEVAVDEAGDGDGDGDGAVVVAGL
jgi:hypothetical protein